jgi:hypothetical protein
MKMTFGLLLLPLFASAALVDGERTALPAETAAAMRAAAPLKLIDLSALESSRPNSSPLPGMPILPEIAAPGLTAPSPLAIAGEDKPSASEARISADPRAAVTPAQEQSSSGRTRAIVEEETADWASREPEATGGAVAGARFSEHPTPLIAANAAPPAMPPIVPNPLSSGPKKGGPVQHLLGMLSIGLSFAPLLMGFLNPPMVGAQSFEISPVHLIAGFGLLIPGILLVRRSTQVNEGMFVMGALFGGFLGGVSLGNFLKEGGVLDTNTLAAAAIYPLAGAALWAIYAARRGMPASTKPSRALKAAAGMGLYLGSIAGVMMMIFLGRIWGGLGVLAGAGLWMAAIVAPPVIARLRAARRRP